MASIGSPPAKKRRTDERQGSEGSIAQANSTLHIFMGANQRQNRWMSGYVSRPEDEEVPRQTRAPVASSTAVNSGPHVQQDTAARAGSSQIQASATSPKVGSNLVQYESPITSTPLSSNAPPAVNTASRKSMDRVPSGGSAMGLPSPVSSGGAVNSPAVALEAAAPRRGRPPSAARNSVSNTAVLPSNGSPSPRTQSQMQPPMPHQHPQGGQMVYANNRAVYVPSSVGGSISPQMIQPPNAGSQHRRSSSGQAEANNWKAMLHQLEAFERTMMPNLHIGHVDCGRVSLLREAIEKHDWFYICLSQIHCLSLTPSLLPGSAVKLPLQAITYLDMLLCANAKVNPKVLQWLSEFPSDIRGIYASQARFAYDKYVLDVVEFVQRMTMYWEKLGNDCKARGAPPLMDDLLDVLALRSPVLQTTVFRAIARMIKEVSEPLEQLHRLDQEAFARGRKRRTTYEKEAAYQAFRITIQHLVEYEQTYKQAHPAQRPRFVIPQHARTVFQIGIPAPPPPPPPPQHSHGAATNHMNPNQHHPPAHLNTQHISHNRHPSTGVSGSPPQPGTPTTPFIMAYGIPLRRQQHPPSRRLVFPHETEQPRAQPTHPDTMRTALHQAHLRSPVLTPSKLGSPRLYRYIASFALPPRKINKNLPVETLNFDIAQDIYDALPATVPSEEPGGRPSRVLTEQSYTIRLRCASAKGKALKTESGWMEADNYWPDNLYLQCNGHMLEPRRKLHHNRYLPIDLTAIIQPGQNQLTVVVNRMSTDQSPYEYALAVEVVGVINHTSINENIKHISSADSLASIKESLAASDEDDEIAITSSTATIQLFDPHTLTNIFQVPARGAACLHKDCFDLETFLSQRESKNKPGTPSVVDCWRCPICRGDVRPHTLVRDGFMDSVRAELDKKGMLDTRAILVEPDGSWKPKPEDTGGVRSPSLEREERGGSVNTPKQKARVVEVIELD